MGARPGSAAAERGAGAQERDGRAGHHRRLLEAEQGQRSAALHLVAAPRRRSENLQLLQHVALRLVVQSEDAIASHCHMSEPARAKAVPPCASKSFIRYTSLIPRSSQNSRSPSLVADPRSAPQQFDSHPASIPGSQGCTWEKSTRAHHRNSNKSRACCPRPRRPQRSSPGKAEAS